jgi:alpha-L-arabinofuranosidase
LQLTATGKTLDAVPLRTKEKGALSHVQPQGFEKSRFVCAMTAALSQCSRRFPLLALLVAWCLSSAALSGQTNIAIGNTTIQPSVKRLGINLGTLTNYDSGQITKNLIVGNPGFEGQIWNSTIRCIYGSATSCTDEDQYAAWPANFWAGATYQFFYGTAAGRSGTISSSSAPANGVGVTLNFYDSGIVPQQGDYMIVRLTTTGGSSVGWQSSTYGNGTISDNLTDLPPNTLGKQTIALTAPAATDTAQIQTTFDSTNTTSFIQLNGTYQLQFKAKGIGGSNQVLVKLERGSSTPYIYQAVNLSNSWSTYNLTFTANETGSAVNTIALIFSTVYGADSIELDDVSLTQTNGDPSNPSAFRDPVVSALRTLQPGIIRFWENNGQLGETLDNLLTPQFGRQRAGSSAYLTQSSVVDYGLHEFLVLCQTVGAEPWIVVPTTFSTTDAANLMEYLAGTTSTTYGGKRAALGQMAPWTQIFPKIHLEFGNEAWNSTFQGGTILYNQPYGQQAQTIFSAMQNDSSYSQSVAGIFDFVLGGQAASPGYNQGVQGYCNNNTSFTIAPYTMSTVDSYSDNESLFGSTFAEPEALMSSASTSSAEGLSPGEVYQNYVAIQTTSHPVPLSFYEINMSTLNGTITQTAVNSYASSLGAGLMVADTMLQGMQQYGVVNQSLFALPQYEVSRVVPSSGGPGGTVYLWGAVVDMGNTNRKRPQYLALELANQALSSGAAMLQTTQTGDNPTWSENTITNTVQFTGAHYIQSYAFQQGTSFSTIIFNLSRTSALSVTFSGANAPSGTVLMQQLTSANLTDTNESSNVVNIASSTLTNFSGATGLSLPAYSMTVLTWSTSSQAPVISGVTASAITGTSATISWTTDQGSSSQVNYGTSTVYGSSSPLSPTLTTNHSVTLTGLTQGTTYNFDVASANSASQSSTSTNSTFTTPLPAPVISAVTITGITINSATISWTTDQASSSQVSYLSTAAYSSTTAPSLSANSTLSTTHSITLTGLTSSTTYNLVITSENSAGTPGTSSGYSFSTTGAPVISNVVATNVTPTTATITWTTDQPSTSQVLYGTTTNYGSASTGSGTLVTSHSITLTGLSQNTAYNFDVLSANTYGLATTSANYTFTTGLQGPTITYVVSSAVSNTSATITWTTDEASTSQVEYGATTSYGSTSTLNSTLTTSHSVTLTGLTLGTTYNYAVISTNGTGNSSTSSNFSFSTTGGSSTTNIAITSTPVQSTVKRLGITLGTLNNYDSGQMTKNLITQNPGFEGQVWNSVIQCSAGTATTCIDQNAYSSWPAGYWAQASYQVISGAAAGRSGTVSYSTAAGGGYGITLSFADSGTAPSAGSYVIVRKTVPGGSSGGWQTTTSSGGTITDNLTDLPPGTTGQQTVYLSAPTLSDYATISTSFDTTSGMSFVQLNGNYQLQFKAKALGGSNAVGVVLQRSGGTTFLNQIVNLSTTWNTYNLTFTAAEAGAVGSVSLAFNTVYGQDYVELDDVSLTQTSSDPSNTTVFSDGVVNALRTAQPGILRYWGGNGQLGETLNNLLTPQFGRKRAGYSEYAVTSTQIDYGLHEFLVLCQSIGAEPWFVMPSSFSTTDAANLIEYLAGSTATTYGAKRSALGQTTPWTQVFSKIHLEFGEQASNLTYAGGYISDPASYGAQAQAIFAAMQNDGSYAASASSFDFVLGGSSSSPGSITTIQNNCNNNTSFDIAPYTMSTVSSYSTNEALFGSTFAEPEALMSATGTAEGLTPGFVYQAYEAIQQSSHVVPLSFSEINMSTLGGTITQTALNSYVSSLGAGLTVADTMLQGLKQYGVLNQNLYALPGYSYSGRSDGSSVYLFGSVVDMGVTNRKRPQFLALELANQALSSGATMLQTVHSGSNPTWDQPLTNNVYLSGAHYLQSYAFQNGTSFTAVLFNLSRTTTLPVTFSGANEPTGAVQVQQLTSANPTDTNETSNVVAITSSTMSGFSDTAGLSLPPYSMTVLTWSTSTQAPAISGVMAGGISETAATITWTTDEPSSSQVQYGTSLSYGSSSALNSTLSTSHSVTLTGLTPGTTYDFNVTSANSASTTAASSNYTFTTSSSAPVISGVTVVAVNASTTTISWTTDQASTSVLNYGNSTSYGTVAENTSLVTSHSITLANLTPNTVYDFAVTSANSAGTASTSGNYTFAVGNPPVITNIAVSALSASSATITWTTDQATSSLVNYGTTTGYGSTSTVNPALVTSHSVTLTGLSGGTTYDFDVVSANSVGTYTTSPNGTFTTSAGTPVISNVAVSAITSTGATITWTTDQSTSSLVNYGTTGTYGSSTTLNTTQVTSHSVTLTGLTPSTLYDFDVVSANAGGTSATSGNSSFTTAASAAPVISNIVVSSITNTGATIAWTTDQASSSQVSYGITTGYGTSTAVSTTLVTSHSVTLTGLTAGTLYDFAVVSANAANISATSVNSTFTTTGAPVISGVAVTSITNTGATITWTTDQATSSLVNYGTSVTYSSSTTLNTALLTSHSVTLTGLTPGTLYNFDVVSANGSGTSATSANSTFTTTAAAPVISNVLVSALTNAGATITWTTDQASSSQVNYGITTAYGSSTAVNTTLVTSHSVTLTGLTAGTLYDFDVVSTNSGNTSGTSANSTFTTTGAPVISNITVTAITNTGVTITWTTDQATSSLVNYGVTSSYGTSTTVSPALVTSHSVTLTGLTGGTLYDFDVVSVNASGTSVTSANNTFTTSGTPVISNVAVSALTSTGATITWTTDQPTSSLVNYGTSTSYGSSTTVNTTLVTTHSVTLTGLTAGTLYNFDVVSANSTGTSATSANSSFTTAAPAPVISNIAVAAISNAGATITWTTDQASTSLVNYGTSTAYGSSTAVNTTLSTSHSVTLTGLTAGTLYDFDVVSANAGNSSATSANTSFTTTGAPVISSVAVTAITNTSATITWTTDQATSSLVNYGTSSSYGSSTTLNTTLVTSHSVTLSGLTAGTLYDLDVVSANASGTSATSANSSFTTTGTPLISNVAVSALTSTSATITWTTDQATSSLVNYGASASYGSSSPLNSTFGTSHSVTLSGLTAGTLYDFDVVSANASGTSATSGNLSFTTPAATAPIITNIAVTTITNTGATITWTTDQNSTSQVNYGTTTAYGSSTTVNTTLATSHSVTITGLTAGTLYDFVVVSANASNTAATSGNSTFTTTGAPLVSNVAVSGITSTGATITWTTDQPTSSQVNYGTSTSYGSSTTVNTALVTSHSITLTGLAASTLYDFDVVSANASGTPAASANSSFTTMAAAAPVISNIVVTAITNTGATITWTTDQTSTSLVNYGTTSAYGASTSVNPTLVTSHSVTLTGLTAGTLYDFDVVSANSGNTSTTSGNATFTTTGMPVISNVVVSGLTNTSATITWTTDQGTSSQVNYGPTSGYGTSTPLNPTLATSHSVTLTGLSAGTLYDFDVVSANASGTSATSGNSTFTTTGAPLISNVAVSGITSTGATITWTTDQPTSSLVNYGATSAYGTSTTLNTALVTSHSVTLTGLTAGTLYDFDVVSANASGTSAASSNSTLTTAGAPVISSVAVNGITTTGATITWTTDQPTSSLVNYGTSNSYGSSTTLSTTLVTSHSVTLTGLTPGTLYDFDVVSANATGTSATSANTTFTTTAAPPPAISAILVSAITNTGATITWTTDQASTSLVNYGTTTSYGTATSVNTTLVTSHSVILTGLTAGTLYDFDVLSANAGNTSSTSGNTTFTTTGTPLISNVSVSAITSTGATITWTTDQPTSSLVNYGASTSYGSSTTVNTALVTSHSVTLTGLTASTLYDFDVASANGTGTSVTSSNSTFTTTAAPSPVISSIAVSAITNTGATITWTTDEASTSLVNYGTTTGYGSSTPASTTLVTSHSVTLTGLAAGTLYDFDVVSANAGNASSTSANTTFTTTGTAPAPVISNIMVTTVSTTSETISWTTDQATTSLLNYGTSTSYGLSSTLNTLTTSHSVTLTGLTASTTYNFEIVATTASGSSTTSANYTWPDVGYVAFWGVNNSGVTISWSSDLSGNTMLAYGTSTALGQFAPVQTTLATSHGVVLTGLNSGTTYYFAAQSTAANGETAVSATYSFTTTGTASPAPVISAVTASGITNSSATITWTTDQLSSSQVNYGTTNSYGSSSTLNTTLATSHSVTLTGLTAGTTYNFDVVSANSSGTSSVSTNYTFVTSSANGAPVISAVTATSVSTTSETITWTTDQASSSLVDYGTTGSYGSASALNTSLTTSHSVTLTGLAAGTTYDFAVVSANAASASSTSPNATFTTASPTPVISAVTATNVSATSETITWTTDQATSSLVNYGTSTSYGSSSTLNTALTTSHSVTITGLTGGTIYDFDVVSANSAGTAATSPNSTFATPTASGTAPNVGYVAYWGVNNSGVTISWSTDVLANTVLAYGTTTALGQFTPVQSTLSASHGVVLTGLNSGTTYYFVAESTGANGVTGYSTTYSFTTTGTASPSPVISAVTATGVTATSATITWTTDQSSSSLVNYGTSSSYGSSSTLSTTLTTSHSVTLTGLTAGTTYNFDVVSANASSVSSTSTNYTFTTPVTGGPVISAVTATSLSNTSEMITWTTDVASTSQVTYGTTTSYGSSSTMNATLTTSHSVTLTGLTAGTLYDFEVISANATNVTSTSPNATFTTTAGTPVISAVTATNVSSTSETITWTTDQATSSLVNYGTTTGYGSSSTLSTALTTSHSVTLTGLTAGTSYDFDVVSANAGGTAATSSNNTFATPATAATPPYVGYVAYWGINNTGITISWSTDVNSNTVLAYGTTTALGQIYTNTASGQTSTTSHGVVLTGLNPGTTYYFVAESTSTANGATGYSTTYSFTTTGTASSPAPVISAVTASGITSTSATITWTTDQSTSSLVNYGTTTSYGSSSTLNTTLTTSHSVTVTGLTAGTTYNFDVVSANSSSVSATSPNATFTTSSSTGAPVITAVTATSVSNTSETITWTTDQATSSLVNYGTTTGYGTSSTLNTTLTTSHSVTLTGLMAGTTYNFDVVSANSANTSSTSPNATFTTSSTVGTPVISAVTATSVSSTSETITWTTDQSTSSLVNYGTGSSYGSSSTLNTTLTTSHSVTLTGLTASTTYDFDVVSANSSGTSATSANATFATAAGSTSGTAPNVSYVAYWGITSSGITISWSTDQSATTQVAYGTTAALGQFTTLQTTLATSHGAVLTGLNPGTTYYFQAQSTSSGGVTGYSTTYSFTTLTAGPPTVSGITVTPKTGNTAVISWTTSVPTTSYVQYGTTTSYNYYSAQTSLTASPSCSLGFVPSGLIHYQLVSTDSNGNQYLSPDYTFTEP